MSARWKVGTGAFGNTPGTVSALPTWRWKNWKKRVCSRERRRRETTSKASPVFRGWFYFEICRYWGGMPYINRVLSSDESLITEEFNRLNFQETAKLMAKDFREAADLLPNHWDLSQPGQATIGHNMNRINKFHALAYLGKALLCAASPMINEEATGNVHSTGWGAGREALANC